MTSEKSGVQTVRSKRRNSRAALSRIKDHLCSAVPEPAVLRLIGRESKQKGTSKRNGLERLVSELVGRRRIIRKLIAAFRRSARDPFPNWRNSSRVALPVFTRRDEAAQVAKTENYTVIHAGE